MQATQAESNRTLFALPFLSKEQRDGKKNTHYILRALSMKKGTKNKKEKIEKIEKMKKENEKMNE